MEDKIRTGQKTVWRSGWRTEGGNNLSLSLTNTHTHTCVLPLPGYWKLKFPV